jgi:branched-chain amino acid transport system permease protein
MIFGIVETVGAQFITTTSATMLSFLLFIVVLVIRPKGLMGKI